MTEGERKVVDWHRGLFPVDHPAEPQMEKLHEEVDELQEAVDLYSKNPTAATRNEVYREAADCAICLIIMLGRMGLSLDWSVRRKFEDNVRRSNGEGKPIKGVTNGA